MKSNTAKATVKKTREIHLTSSLHEKSSVGIEPESHLTSPANLVDVTVDVGDYVEVISLVCGTYNTVGTIAKFGKLGKFANMNSKGGVAGAC